MPLYEYQCKKCQHRFEKIQKFSDAPIKKCPECGGKVEKLLSSPAVQFKGSGWYVTDYARKSGGSAESGTSSNGDAKGAADKSEKADKGEKTEATKTEKKPAKK